MDKKKTKISHTDDMVGYMKVKIRKLESQFIENAPAEKSSSNATLSNIFNGISIFVNGYTEPSAIELKRLMMIHGGVYCHYYKKDRCTHIIASNLAKGKVDALKTEKVVSAKWITDSINAGTVLSHEPYLLYPQPQQEKIFKLINKIHAVNGQSSPGRPEKIVKINHLELSNAANDKNNKEDERQKEICEKNMSVNQVYPNANSRYNSITATDKNFLSEFYNNSRLHHISSAGAEFKRYISSLQSNVSKNFPGLERLKSLTTTSCVSEDSFKQIIMHIDIDCFFVSVGLLNHPHLKGQPVAVAHSSGKNKKFDHEEISDFDKFYSTNFVSNKNNSKNVEQSYRYSSMSEIACCSYEARGFGLHNGMFLGDALKLCPSLNIIQYEFDNYNTVSMALYNLIASYTHDIEAVSCDEMYVNCTKILHETGVPPLVFAEHLRKEVKESTGCNASTGLGTNMLLARLATRKAKPNGSYYLQNKDKDEFMADINVKDLPGIGRRMETRLAAINVTKCKELQKISLGVLRKEFGQKTGDNLFKYARGICNRQLQFSHERKSVSAEVNYGIRFQNTEEALKFLQELTVEVSKRLKDISAKGKVVCLKIKVRKEDADVEPAKFLGHGSCDNVTRSVSLQDYTDCSSVIFKNCSYLLQMMKVLPQDLRGVGIQVQKLNLKDHNEETKTQSTLSSMFIKMSEKNSKKKLDNAPNDSLPSGSKNSCTDNRIVLINKNVQKGPGITEKINQLVSKLGLNSKHDSSISSTSLGDFYPSQYCQLDESVLNQLPDDIRYQIKEHYSKNKSSRDEDQLTNEAPVTERNISSLPNITSIDQSVFSSLPADIQNELRSAYSNQISNTLPSPLKSENIKSNQKQILSYKSSPSKSPLKGKWRKKKKSSPMKIVPGNSKITNHLIPTKSNYKETCHRHEVVDIKDTKNSDELQEPTLNGKNNISDIKILIQEWALMCQVPSDDDIKMFSDYLVDLVNFKDLEKLDLVVKCLHRQLSKKDNLWHEAYFDIINNIQAEVISNYGRALHVNMVF